MTNYGKIESLDPARLVPPNQAIFPAHFERSLLDIKIVLDELRSADIVPELTPSNISLILNPIKSELPYPYKPSN